MSSTANPVVPTAPTPTQQTAPTAVVVADDVIVAKPLVDADFTDIKQFLKNPALEARWVNRAAGGGARYDSMKAQGFRNALLTDFKDNTIQPHLVRDGAVIYGDLIAMVIDGKKYKGALAWNEQRARARLGSDNDVVAGREKMSEALNEVAGSPANKAKIKLYKPGM